MTLLELNSNQEYQEFKRIFMTNSALFELHTYIGGTKMNSNSWYWINTGKTIDTIQWGRGEPNGAHVQDYCTDILRQEDDLVINDLPCRSTQYIFKFICESIDVFMKIKF